jgi:hypothetical protein
MKIIAALMISALLVLPANSQQVAEKKSVLENLLPSLKKESGSEVPQQALEKRVVNIMPHRAFYTVKLKSANGDSSVQNTDGRMIIELTHDCEGWTLTQESASVVDLKSAPSEMMRSVYTAWESEDGKSLRFKTERIFNEKLKDSVEGMADFTGKGGTITYQTPEIKEVTMRMGTLPPIAHMKKLIETAASGKQTYSIQVFDGSFYGNPVLIDTFIGDKKGVCKITESKSMVYPMNLAIYAMPSTSSNPNFEIKQNMGENGVMCSYEINFGDYTVEGKLDRFEPLPDKSCTIKGKS